METILAYILSGFNVVQEVGTWAYLHPEAAAVVGGIIAELVAKYSPWRGADGLVEIVGKAIIKSMKKPK